MVKIHKKSVDVKQINDFSLSELSQTSDTRIAMALPQIDGTYHIHSQPFRCQYFLTDHVWAFHETATIDVHGYVVDEPKLPECLCIYIVDHEPIVPKVYRLLNRFLNFNAITDIVYTNCGGMIIRLHKDLRDNLFMINFIVWCARQFYKDNAIKEARNFWQVWNSIRSTGTDGAIKRTISTRRELRIILKTILEFDNDSSVYKMDDMYKASFLTRWNQHNINLAEEIHYTIHECANFGSIVARVYTDYAELRPLRYSYATIEFFIGTGIINEIRRKIKYEREVSPVRIRTRREQGIGV